MTTHEAKRDEARRDDDAVSPMEAQNEGSAGIAPDGSPKGATKSKEPAPGTTTGHGSRGEEPAETPIRRGGESESRDDG